MLFSLFILSLGLTLAVVVGFAAWALAARSSNDREKCSPFECGFDPKKSARLPFSLRFFLLAVIFLVFDIEIVLIMPIPIALALGMPSAILIPTFIFIIILLLGLLHEWNEGSLDWTE